MATTGNKELDDGIKRGIEEAEVLKVRALNSPNPKPLSESEKNWELQQLTRKKEEHRKKYNGCYLYCSYVCSGEINVCKCCGKNVCESHSYNDWTTCHFCDD